MKNQMTSKEIISWVNSVPEYSTGYNSESAQLRVKMQKERNAVEWLSKAYSDDLVAEERKRYKEFVMKCIDGLSSCQRGYPHICHKDKDSCENILYVDDLKSKLECVNEKVEHSSTLFHEMRETVPHPSPKGSGEQ